MACRSKIIVVDKQILIPLLLILYLCTCCCCFCWILKEKPLNPPKPPEPYSIIQPCEPHNGNSRLPKQEYNGNPSPGRGWPLATTGHWGWLSGHPLNHMGIQSLIIVLVRKVFHFHDGHRHWMSYEYIFLIWFPDEISMELSNCLENFRFLWIV
jgi:hypothetical protein